jgi:hypothetical protein
MVSYVYILTKLVGASKGFWWNGELHVQFDQPFEMVRYVYSLTQLVDASKCFWRNGELYVQFYQP